MSHLRLGAGDSEDILQTLVFAPCLVIGLPYMYPSLSGSTGGEQGIDRKAILFRDGARMGVAEQGQREYEEVLKGSQPP